MAIVLGLPKVMVFDCDEWAAGSMNVRAFEAPSRERALFVLHLKAWKSEFRVAITFLFSARLTRRGCFGKIRAFSAPPGVVDTVGYSSGQRGQTVNLLAMPSKVRILAPPPLRKARDRGLFRFSRLISFPH